MSDANEIVDKLLQELRRGTITIGVLSQLAVFSLIVAFRIILSTRTLVGFGLFSRSS